ncbi:methylamine dehydrogenase accessory protein MauD [Geminicoccaceae bacterium 1502E]|nr:methylamine dehydrogenase accessory protein MauD [Geminicoccaceae bacterium 1502E]
MLEAVIVSQLILWLAVLGLAATVFALARQIGVLHERVAPVGALITQNTAEIGEAAQSFEVLDLAGRKIQVGGRPKNGRSQFLLFVSPSCPVCKKLLGVARSFARAERTALDLVLVGDGDRVEHEALVKEHGLEGMPLVISPVVGMTYGIGKLPYAMLIDAEGVVRSKGLVNSREHLESLLTAQESGFASIQDFMESKSRGAAA